jgi:ribosome-binding protein aMBF1 (putative translation factor)
MIGASIMANATMKMAGETFVLVPQSEYRQLVKRPVSPAMPEKTASGNYPALEAARVIMARSIIKDREAAGMTQKALAAEAGIRAETLNRIKKGRVMPDTATLTKIDAALTRMGRKSAQ